MFNVIDREPLFVQNYNSEGPVETEQSNPCEGTMQQVEPFWQVLYRYFWPFPYFRDVTRGLRMERQQNYRHNRAMRVYLPGFVCKWALLTAVCFLVGMALGNVPAPVALTACFYVTGSWTLVVSVLLLTAWCWLERFPELY